MRWPASWDAPQASAAQGGQSCADRALGGGLGYVVEQSSHWGRVTDEQTRSRSFFDGSGNRKESRRKEAAEETARLYGISYSSCKWLFIGRPKTHNVSKYQVSSIKYQVCQGWLLEDMVKPLRLEF